MNNADFVSTTRAYYEKWLGEDGCLSGESGLRFIYSVERNVSQYGYSECFDLYIWLQQDRIIVSYGDSIKPYIDKIMEAMSKNTDIRGITASLESILNHAITHRLIYRYEKLHLPETKARPLNIGDYKGFEVFFLMCNSDVYAAEIDWLPEYFEEIVQSGFCVGIYEDDNLVCCTDAPGMPYMADRVQEIGVNTIPEYRKKGYAVDVCARLTENILDSGRVPQWSTTIDNIGSQRLAERVGFIKIADVLSVSISE